MTIDLAITPMFAAMSPDLREQIAARATRRRVKRGQRVLGRGDAAIVVLVAGRIDVIGDFGTVRSLVPPATAGISLAAGAPSTAELRAAEDSVIFVVPAEALTAALRRNADAAIAAIAHLGAVIGELSNEIEALRRHGIVDRLRHRLAQLAVGRRELVITHAQIAEEIGGTRANVTRALAQLAREGLVELHRGRIVFP